MDYSLITLIISIIVLIFVRHFWRRKYDPPGPIGVPFFGSMLSMVLSTSGHEHFIKFLKRNGQQYGRIWSFELGYQKFVVLHSSDVIRKALLEHGEVFSGRPISKFYKDLGGEGILSIDGEIWRNQRRFVLTTLRNFGLGKRSLEPQVLEEAEYIESLIDKNIGKPQNTADLLVKGISNIISVLLFGKRWDYDDATLNQYIESLHIVTHASGISMLLPIFFPFLANEWFYSITGECKRLIKNNDIIKDIIKKECDKVAENYNIEEEPSNVIEAYLQQIHATGGDNKESTKISQMVDMGYDLFAAGTDTTTNSLGWALYMLSVHPQIQQKIHSELDAIVGRERRPQMSDKKSLTYLQAVMDEVARFCTIVPHALDHRVMEPIYLEGYKLTEDDVVMVHINGVHKDPKLWDNPDEFNPSRFLSSDGHNYQPNENLIPFSLGKRRCLGESLAQMEYFIILACLMQRYRVELDEESKSKSEDILEGSEGIIHSPGLHEIIFTRRNI